MAIPDWQLPPGVDRGLWDYLHSQEMVRGYDEQMAASPLAAFDVQFCESAFPRPGKLLDLGCGTGRLDLHFARKGFDCTGVDLSPEMLAHAERNATAAGLAIHYQLGNIVDLANVPEASFDYAACLFSTLGMVRGPENREAAIRSVARVLKPGGRFVLHVHNRDFLGLKGKGLWNGDITMSQAYAGAPLTLHHYTIREAKALLARNGFRIGAIRAVSIEGELKNAQLFGRLRAYGYLFDCERNPSPPVATGGLS